MKRLGVSLSVLAFRVAELAVVVVGLLILILK